VSNVADVEAFAGDIQYQIHMNDLQCIITKKSCWLPLGILLGPKFFYKVLSLQDHKPTAPAIGRFDLMKMRTILMAIFSYALNYR
jgi:hypothetical protein